MATVYLARDGRHERQVAVKVIRPELSAVIGADRFLQEIKLTAHLQHPHILPLYDSGSADGLLYYVMPYVTGESLRVRLERERQLPVDEAITIVRALAQALDYAHRQGVVHRDIKPENILLQDGQPLLADFGIALALTAAGGDRLTQTGLSLGTPHYMSPEQAAGDRKLDGRTDIYALGCVAYEMLAGAPPHVGPTAQAVIASVITEDPRPLAQLRRSVPAPVAAAIHRSLQKIPADRFSTGAQFAEALSRQRSSTASTSRRRLLAGATPAWLGIGLAAGGLAGWMLFHQKAHAAPAHRFDLVLPETAPIALTGPGPLGLWQSALALSPDATLLAYVSPQEGTTRLLVRRLSGDTTVTLTGTDGAFYPFFSPDGKSLGFFSGNDLRKVPVAGGTPVTLLHVDRPVGATWPSRDSILLMEKDGFSMRWVRASGGGSNSTITLGTQFCNPVVLPGRRWVVGQLSSGQLALLSVRDGKELAITRRGVQALDAVKQEDLLMGVSPKWISSGHLVFGAGDGVLMALPFDGPRARPLGPPVPVIPGVRIEEGFGYTEYALADDGTLVFVPGANQSYGRIALVNRNGTFDTLPYGSTDGGIAVSPVPPTGAIYQVAGRGQQPLWTRGGDRIIYRDGHRFYEVTVQAGAGFRTGAPRLYADGPFVRAFAWNQSITADGRLATVVALPERSTRQLAIVTGFDTELKRLAAPR